MIGRALAAALVTTLLLGSAALAQQAEPLTLQSTVWRWVHSAGDVDAFIAPLDRDRYTVEFGPNGALRVRADCNQMSGTYREVRRRLTLQLGPSTLVACPPGSKADVFVQQLGAVASYVTTDTALVLNLRQDSGSMVFEPQPVASLSGTNWQVLAYNNGNAAVTTPLLDTSMSATFGEDGIVSGSSGCNSYNGPYSVDDAGSMAIGPLATTRMACAEDILDQEQAYLAALQASTRFKITADRLELRNDEGAKQVDFLAAPPE